MGQEISKLWSSSGAAGLPDAGKLFPGAAWELRPTSPNPQADRGLSSPRLTGGQQPEVCAPQPAMGKVAQAGLRKTEGCSLRGVDQHGRLWGSRTACAGPAHPLPAGGATSAGVWLCLRGMRDAELSDHDHGGPLASAPPGEIEAFAEHLGEMGNCPKGSTSNSPTWILLSRLPGGHRGPIGDREWRGEGSFLTATLWNQGAPSRVLIRPLCGQWGIELLSSYPNLWAYF